MATEMQSFYTPSTSTHISSHAPAAVDELINKYSSTMSVSATSPSSPLGNARRNLLQRAADCIRLKYYQYEVTFGLYVMTPGEKLVANSFVVVVLTLLFWALLVYFPALLYQKLSRLVWLLTGHSGEEMGAAFGILDTHVNSITQFSAKNLLS
ncbi:hypothetical protein P175DRAFT_0446264 [Aspergillus ochraceoroseus IBT 24754]|uniref:Uncharacterized protein n=2 Tax=Aspergillus ochraceoroseus TaxID=138278 RepID=A0A2T5LLW8_9EURO|nr:uncharacterized protein P175DRAFT_0446264 [Aspergillus ochraceoroseus IBT 24754]KKK18678.1 hypothetical protein AOCH_004893 [Aspergillus ochraceoroseus]PTU17278.1 hypothetical protein P175DRAFT_0446264 [Aspergillus ochraceoroseus IBT 24754]